MFEEATVWLLLNMFFPSVDENTMDINEQLDHDFDNALNRNYEPDDIAQPMYDGIQYVGGKAHSRDIGAHNEIDLPGDGRNPERFRAVG